MTIVSRDGSSSPPAGGCCSSEETVPECYRGDRAKVLRWREFARRGRAIEAARIPAAIPSRERMEGLSQGVGRRVWPEPPAAGDGLGGALQDLQGPDHRWGLGDEAPPPVVIPPPASPRDPESPAALGPFTVCVTPKARANARALLRRAAQRAGVQVGRVRKCGTFAVSGGDVRLTTRETDEGHVVSQAEGLAICGNAWSCPVCAHRVRMRHAAQVKHVAESARREGCSVYLVTLTLRHSWGDDLRAMRAGLADAWTRVQRGAPWARWKRRVGWIGAVRAMEVTHGRNGWHPHLHLLVVTEEPLQEEPCAWLAHRWSSMVRRALGPAHLPVTRLSRRDGIRPEDVVFRTPGLDVVRAHDGDGAAAYMTKLGLEVAGASKGRRTPWSLLSDASDGDRWAAGMWAHYRTAMDRTKVVTYTRSLRDRYGVVEEDNAEPEPGDLVVAMPGTVWRRCLRAGAELAILEALTRRNAVQHVARIVLDVAGIEGEQAMLAATLSWETGIAESLTRARGGLTPGGDHVDE